jgi:hypothetical protein
MARTRNNNNGENSNDGNSPPPTLEQVLMMQAQMLQTKQQTMANMQQNQQVPQPQQKDKLGDFQRTKSSSFSHCMESLDADDWLKTVKKKLQIVQCNNREKVLLASHQLVGPIADWWDAYVEAHEEPNSINWNEFKAVFRSHHVPEGIMKLKKKEFQDLKQGSMTVSEYVTHFTQLSCYAPSNVDTDEKKQDCFLNGLNDGLAYALEARDFENFQAMVNKALVLENRRGILERKHKQERQSQHSTNSRSRIGSSSAGPIFRPTQQNVQPMLQPTRQRFVTPQRQMISCPNGYQTPNTGYRSVQRTPANQNVIQTPPDKKCYNCGHKGHFVVACPNLRSRPPPTPTSNSAPPSNRNGNSSPVQSRQNYAQGRVNQLAMEEAQNALMNGTFLVNSYSVLTIP